MVIAFLKKLWRRFFCRTSPQQTPMQVPLIVNTPPAELPKKIPPIQAPTKAEVRTALRLRSPYDLLILCKVLSPKGGRTKLVDGFPHNKEAAKDLSSNHRRNWNDIIKNWDAIELALELVYGEIKKDPWSPNNKRIISQKVRWLRKFFHLGVYRAGKEFSTSAREDAILGTKKIRFTRGKRRFHLFLASTLSRALIAKQSREVVQGEVEDAIQRITTAELPVSRRLLRRLRHFVKTKVLEVKRTSPVTLSLPQHKSCYERSAAKGGALLESYERYGRMGLTDEWLIHSKARTEYAVQKMRDRGLLLHLDQKDATIGSQTVKKIFMAYYSDNNPQYVKDLPHAPMVCAPGTAFEKALKDVRRQTFCKICPIEQPDGKVRVATLHTCSTIWIARNLSCLLLPYLKRIGFSRTMLRNEEVVLENNDPQALLYSADLTKSTDPISIALCRSVLHTIVDNGIDMPSWARSAIDSVITNYTLEHNAVAYKVVCGALMGLGPGWTALSFINAFCAKAAGATEDSFKVCGDDLIGFWSPEVIKQYNLLLEKFRLKSNPTKSFCNRDYGVFCERFVVRKGTTAHAKTCVRIGEAVGSRAIDGDKGLLVVDSLKRAKACRQLYKRAQRTSYRQALGNQPGRISQGGGGRVVADARTFKAFVLGERLTLCTKTKSSRASAVHHEAMMIGSTGSGIRLSTLMIKLRSEEDRIDAHHHRVIPNPVDLKERKTLKNALCRMRQKVSLDKRSPIKFSDQELKERGYPKSLRSRVTWHLRYRRFSAAIEAIRSYDPVIPSEEAHALLDKHLPEWRQTTDIHLQPTPIREVGENRYLAR
jgi:hypothetical protein